MIIEKTEEFTNWFNKLKDTKGKAIILTKIYRIESQDYLGDCKSVGDKVYELRIHYGPGYRVYYHKDGDKIIILLCGGDKSTQAKDIVKAKSMIT